MSDAFISFETPSTPDEDMIFASILAEMNRLREQIDRDQHDIDRLKQECSALKSETRALIDSLRASLMPC
jgi:hypothetical protein